MIEEQDQHKSAALALKKSMFKDIIPYDKRNCTDICCIVIGLLFSITILIIALVSVNVKHQTQTSIPSDSSGKVCGDDYPKYTFLYFTNPPDITQRVCVSKCPVPGSSQLDCTPSGNIGCKFNNIPNFAVVYYDNEEVIDTNGNFCMPTDPALKEKVLENANLKSRLLFFNSYSVLVLCLLFAIGLSILFAFVVHCAPKKMMWITIFASLVAIIALAAILFSYKTSNPGKIYLGILLVVLFIIIAVSVYYQQKQISLAAIFLSEATKFTWSKPSTFFYVLLFMGCTLGFFVMLIQEYRGLISVKAPVFNNNSIYYGVDKHGLWLTCTLLGIQLLWGLSFLKEAFNFCICAHAIKYYLKKGGGMCSIVQTLELLVLKHLGSVIAGAFINIFFFIPDLILDFFRFDNSQCCECGCLKFFDLVRSDALAYVGLTGNPYCNSAKYCEYFTQENITSQSNQSAMRLYRICAHIMIAGLISILGLFIKGQIQPYTIAATIVIGMFVSTYIISYQADPADAMLLMYNIDFQFFQRSGKKVSANCQDKAQQQVFLKWLENDFAANREFAKEIKELKAVHWENIENKTEG